MTDMDQFLVMADKLWDYFKKKIKDMLSTHVSYFRAQVVSNPGNGTLEIRRPFDQTTLNLPCTQAISDASEGDQVIVFVLGDLSNAVVVSDGKMTKL